MTAARRHRLTCPVAGCSYVADRSKREAAEHVMAQHVAYTHEAPPAVALDATFAALDAPARCAVCGGPNADGSGCEFCPAVDHDTRGILGWGE